MGSSELSGEETLRRRGPCLDTVSVMGCRPSRDDLVDGLFRKEVAVLQDVVMDGA